MWVGQEAAACPPNSLGLSAQLCLHPREEAAVEVTRTWQVWLSHHCALSVCRVVVAPRGRPG